MRARKLTIVGAVLLISAFMFLVWIGGASAEEKSLESLYTSLGVQRITPPVEALDFTLKNLEGSTVSLKDFEGKVVFLNFWATWCGPCRIEMPSMEKLWQRFKEADFVILAVDLREGKEEVESFMKEFGLTFPVLLDSRGEVANTYGIRAIPTTFLIDPEGKIVGKALGARDWASQDAFDLIEHLLPETKSDSEKQAPQVKEISITAKKYEFQPNTITVNQGDRVKLKIKSIDVTHGFGLPEFGVDVQLKPEKTVEVEFVADKKGTFDFRCTVFCGLGHGRMRGKLVVK